MKKCILILILFVFIFSFSSCKRTSIEDPTLIQGPATFHYIVEGSADPSVIFVDGIIHTSKITVKVTDFRGNPVAGKYIYLEIRLSEDPDNAIKQAIIWWGYFENGFSSIRGKTDGNGVMTKTYYGPDLISIPTLGDDILIKATMADDNQSYFNFMPYDFINIVFIREGEG